MTDITTKEAFFQPRKAWDPLSRLLEDLRKTFVKEKTMSSVITKPSLRGLLRRQTYVNIAQATAAGLITAGLFHYFFTIPRQAAEKEFFKNYDIEKDNERLMKLGYIWSKERA